MLEAGSSLLNYLIHQLDQLFNKELQLNNTLPIVVLFEIMIQQLDLQRVIYKS